MPERMYNIMIYHFRFILTYLFLLIAVPVMGSYTHSGSATWITDMGGTPMQYLHYMPYGETFAEQSVTPYRERFRFTGKYSKMNKHTLPFRERLGRGS